MKVFNAFSLILPLVSLSTCKVYEFTSAKTFNICGKVYNGGWGWGRVEMGTISAQCLDQKQMSMRCWHHLPRSGGEAPGEYTCSGRKQSCLPAFPAGKNFPDAACITLFDPMGTKGAGDLDNYACSSGVNVGNAPIWVLSSISTDKPIYVDSTTECSVVRSGTQNSIYKSSHCDKTSTVLKLAAKTTYQACIRTAAALAKTSVSFTWHLSGPGKLTRGLQQHGNPISEMFTIDNSTSNGAIQIVIGD
ncbi:hypothetical protein Vi05172_g2905 [Venturia inaequalis]|nr:hypothetical protein Vi05172_g2905 [Venturia inaequalis]